MAVVAQPTLEKPAAKKGQHENTFTRVSRYVVVRLLTLFVTSGWNWTPYCRVPGLPIAATTQVSVLPITPNPGGGVST